MKIHVIKCDQCSEETQCPLPNRFDNDFISFRMKTEQGFASYDFCCEECLKDFFVARSVENPPAP